MRALSNRSYQLDQGSLAALAVIFMGLLARLWLRAPVEFWEDEIIAATHAMLPVPDLLVNTLRYDIHPPLYFLQLHWWSFAGQSDRWLMMNSIVWSIAGLASIWWVAGALWDARMGLLSAAVYAVLPSPLYMAHQLRMYAMLAVLIIWSFYFATNLFHARQKSHLQAYALVTILLAILLTHASSVIFVFANGLYALIGIRRNQCALLLWCVTYGICAAFAAPWTIFAAAHDPNLDQIKGLYGSLIVLASATSGITADRTFSSLFIGDVALVLVAGLGLIRQQTRSLTLAMIIFPVGLCWLLSLIIHPIFKWNFLSTIEAPFVAMVLAWQLRAGPRFPRLSAIALALSLFGVALDQKLHVLQSSQYRQIAATIHSNYRPGDVIYVPQTSYFWGIAWYLLGPDWGSPLNISAQPSPKWLAVYRALGPKLVADLHLVPRSQTLRRYGYDLLTGNTAPDVKAPHRVWLVSVARADLPRGYPPISIAGLPMRWQSHGDTQLTLYSQ